MVTIPTKSRASKTRNVRRNNCGNIARHADVRCIKGAPTISGSTGAVQIVAAKAAVHATAGAATTTVAHNVAAGK